MDIRKLQRVIVNALEDVKAQDIKIFNTSKQTALFERVIVATANSNRQTRALGHHVFMEVKENGGDAVGIEGLETGEWVLVDCGSAIVHIMQPALRAYYNLEELWGGHPVRMKLLEDENLDALFAPNPIYTKIRDDNPTRYINGSKAKNVMVADGCVIEGEVENSILFRGVHIGKGAKVKNCVLMQDTVVEDNASVEYVITDKDVTITEGKSLTGNDSFQVFVAKGQTV